MPGEDIQVTVGLVDRRFIDSMDQLHRYANRKTWQIAKDFERYERQKERAAAQARQRIVRGYQRMQQANQVAAVAMAAATGVWIKSLQKAAEHNKDIENQLAGIKRASDRNLASLGEDLAPFVNGLARAIDRARVLREELASGLAPFLSGDGLEVKNVDLQRRIAAQRNRQFALGQSAADIRAAITGNPDDPDADFRRRMNEQINSVGDRATQAGLRADLDAELARRQAKRERDAAAARQSQTHRRSSAIEDARVRSLAAAAQRDPTNKEAFLAAERARADQQIRAARREIEGRGDGATEREIAEEMNLRIRAIRDEMRVRREAFDERIRQEAAQKEAAQQAAEQRATDELAAQRIELQRIKGNDRVADQLQIIEDHRRRIAEITARENISDARRQALIAGENAIRDARLGALGGITEQTRAAALGPGLAGGATLERQILGAGGGGTGSNTNDPVVKNTNTLVKQVGAIATAVQNGVPAVAV